MNVLQSNPYKKFVNLNSFFQSTTVETVGFVGGAIYCQSWYSAGNVPRNKICLDQGFSLNHRPTKPHASAWGL
jgi:hypothetical protein